MAYFNDSITALYTHIGLLFYVLIVIVHLVSALAVSKDLGHFAKHNITPQMMPNFAWILSVLVMGIWGLFIYWIMHHSSLSRGKN